MRSQAATASNTLSTPVEVSFGKDHIPSDVLSALVEVNFDEIYIAHKMSESPDGSLSTMSSTNVFSLNARRKDSL